MTELAVTSSQSNFLGEIFKNHPKIDALKNHLIKFNTHSQQHTA